MASAKQLIITELKQRQLMGINVFAPYYTASIGGHLFNLNNLARENENPPRDAILYHHGKPFNTRLHIMFVAPPGFGKTTFIEHFLRDKQAMLYNSCVDAQWEGFMTEAGFVGTIREIEGQKIIKPGVALRHQNSIVGMEEFAILNTIMQAGSYGGALIDQLLTALDTGYIAKSLAPGAHKYRTNITIWPGTQVQRFELSSGLPRRFIFMIWFPTRKDQDELKEKWFEGFNVKWHRDNVNKIAKAINATAQKINKLEVGSISYEDEVKEFIMSTGTPHYEFPLFIRLLIGDHIMNDEFNKELRMNLKNGRRELIVRELRWREEIRYDAQMAQVRSILRQNQNCLKRQELLRNMSVLGVDRIEAMKIIDNMVRLKILRRNKSDIEIPVDDGWKSRTRT